MSKIYKTSATLLLFFSFVFSAKASHLAGGEITYSCLGNNQYRIYLNLFVDCDGFNPGATQTINFSSTCGATTSTQVQVTPATVNGLEISQLCASQLPNSTCNNGNLPGMWVFKYEGVVTLTPPCDTWKMSWGTCCRNSAITNLTSGGSADYYIEATLNSVTAPCNSSPQFNAQAIPYVCAGQPVSYSYSVTEPDGDSLHYQLVPALTTSSTSTASYMGAYSGTSPIPGITINPQTGLLTFTPNSLGNFVVVIKVTEYDRTNRKVKGTSMRDIQFVVMNCANIVPSPTAGGITNLSGNAIQAGPYGIEMCVGNNFNFTATYTDANATNILSYITNITTALPGAVVTQVGTSTNPLTLNIAWTAPPGSQGQTRTFTVTVSDNACPIKGQQVFSYSIKISTATRTVSDITICGSQAIPLTTIGGTIFNWTVLSGAPMTPTNFSCNPCANPIAQPNVTTTYEVTSNLSATCKNKDTVTVFVVPDFTPTITQSTTSSCLLKPVQLGVNVVPAASGYSYQWTPGVFLNDSTIQNPIATFTTAGTHTYTVTVTSPSGCKKRDSLIITAIPAYSPVITAYSDTAFCSGGTATLGVNFSTAAPATCGLSSTGGCNGTGASFTIGTGTSTNTTSSYPAPYGNFYKNARQQFLFTAAELTAAGVIPGKIDQLDFNVATISGTTLYSNYTISMGCTNLASLSNWQTGLFQVYTPKNHTVTTGWNSHTFDNTFLWDGISNIIVEICFDNRPAAYTTNSRSPFTTTSFVSCLYYRADVTTACGVASNTPTTSSNRPNVRFHSCTSIANPANYSYIWTPSTANIANATSQNTTAQPVLTTTYTVTVTDLLPSGCSSTDTVNVTITNANAAITNVGPFCTNAPPITMTAANTGGTWSGMGITNTASGTFDPAVAGAGNHIITYAIPGLCGAIDTTMIRIIAAPTISFTPDKIQGCEPTYITFASINDQPGGSCFWDFGDGNTSTNCNPGNLYQVAGTYSVTFTYTNITGCSSTVSQNNSIAIHSQPQAGYTISSVQPTTILEPLVQFNDASTGQIDNWYWNFGRLGNSNLLNPSIAYPDTGSYAFQLIVSNIHGCADTLYSSVYVRPVSTFYAPNAFTPNNNGTNDIFKAYADGLDHNSFEMLIYDRWGELLFKSNNIYNGWNGRKGNTGVLVESDVYVWKVRFNDFSGKENNYIGHVTLVK